MVGGCHADCNVAAALLEEFLKPADTGADGGHGVLGEEGEQADFFDAGVE